MVNDEKSRQFDNNIGILFNNVQDSALNHRRTAIALYKIQTLPAGNPGEYEQLFLSTFFRHVLSILAIKKQEQLVQKLLKFVCTFMSYSAEKDEKVLEENGDSIHQRFMENFIMFLLQGTESKDKSVRHRVCILVAHAMQHIGEMR